MQRNAIEKLIKWKNDEERKLLILRGSTTLCILNGGCYNLCVANDLSNSTPII